MKSRVVKLSAMSLAGMMLLSGEPVCVLANPTAVTSPNCTAESSSAPDSETDTGVSSTNLVETSGDTALAGVNTVVAEEAQLDIKYDRLGLANVDESLNVRAKASLNAKIIAKMSKNAACNIEKITKDGWAKIQSGNIKGYVKAEYLVMDEEAEALALKVGKKIATVKTTTLNARFLPSTESGKYTLVPCGEELEVIREEISEKYVSDFIEKHFTDKKSRGLIQDVDQEQMKQELNDWLCVSIDDEKVFVAREFVDISYALKRAVSTEVPKEKKNKKSSDGSGSVRSSMVSYAMQFLGNPYVYGGTSLTNGTDCSGFTMGIYQHFGYSIPRTSATQASYTRTISASEAQPGDLFFYGYGSSVSHVAMYIGGGQVIHASNERTGIKISNAYYRTPIKVGRVIG